MLVLQVITQLILKSMTQKITYTFLGDFLTQFDITVDDIANANGYPPIVAKTEDELPAKVMVDYTNPVTGETTQTEQYPEGTEFDKPNPETRLMFVARVMPVVGMERMIANLMQDKVRALQAQIRELEKQPKLIAEAYAVQSIAEVVE
jgi:hypothetical protein